MKLNKNAGSARRHFARLPKHSEKFHSRVLHNLKLYAVTDRAWLNGQTLEHQVECAIKGGATFIQLREKDISDDEYIKIALEVKKVTDKYNIPLVINDNVTVAQKSDVDGVHLGQGDMSASDARKILGNDKIVGVSAQTVEQAITAEKSGADYLGVGAVFSTSTKLDADSVSYETLKQICSSVSIPVIAIGGINEGNILKLKGTGIDGVAVVSAIFAKEDIETSARCLYDKIKECLND